MEIYRIFDSVVTAFVYNQSYQGLYANTKLYVGAICAGAGVWLVLQVLLGFGLYAMAKRLGMEKRAMAFIPFVNMLYAGKIAGECRFFSQRMKQAGIPVMIAQILLFAASLFTVVAETTLYMNYIVTVQGNSVVYTTGSGGEPTSALANFFIAYDNAAVWILSVLELVYTILLFILASGLFRKYTPASYMFLSCLTLFVPSSFAIAVFALRNRKAVDYEAYIRKRNEAYYRRYGGGNGNPYGNPYGGGTYGSQSSEDPFKEAGEASRENDPFSEFGGASDGKNGGGTDGADDSPFSDIDG
ncbi:MAG: hypothetical protein ACI4SH_02200 [Candidatus Scatosoma sp.]